MLAHFAPQLAKGERSLLAVLSAKVGSIGDNRLGGWYSYRASKAALNMLLKTAAIEVARTHPQAVLAALHPGTVDSALSAPFRGAQIGRPAPDAARDLLAVLDSTAARRQRRLLGLRWPASALVIIFDPFPLSPPFPTAPRRTPCASCLPAAPA